MVGLWSQWKNQQVVDELIQRLQQLGELGESTPTSEFMNYIEELLDVNKQLSDMFEK